VANKRVVDGQDTQARLENTWNAIVDQDEHSSLAEFARRAQISYTALCHRYSDWADRVRTRRDKKHGARKKSPVTLSKASARSLTEALDQVTELRKTNLSLRRELENAQEEIGRLRDVAGRGETAEEENERWRGLLLDLEDQLKLIGVPQNKIVQLWELISKQIRVTRS
jgi:predicted  nucleic acid-binding Zn-ribbon protein